MTRTTARLVRIAGGLVAGAVLLGGCSSGGHDTATHGGTSADSSASVSDDFNDSDVAFAQGMIPHHEGALTMSEMAVERATDPRVLDLAERIEAGQDPEIDLMTGWLEEWGRPVGADGTDGNAHGSGGMGHGPDDMGGMDMENMPAAGPDFDRRWLEAMIVHHEGAVEMAETEIDDGRNADAIDLARRIIEAQTQEIEEMRQLLSELGG
jgi:uncharacterized protein (DUF305 family)